MTTQRSTQARILAVDDNPMNLDILCSILQARGYETMAANGGEQAIAIARDELPDLVMLDINMPGMNGYEVCATLKSDEATRDIPVIFLSALDHALDKVKAFEAGGADYVTKPFQAPEILARINNQLKLARLQREMEEKNAELARKNEELVRSTEQILESYKTSALIFSALSHTLPGKVLDGKYHLENLIGRGGYGAVFRGVHLRLKRVVAIKVLRPARGITPVDLERFRIEGISASLLNHPNSVEVFDSGVSKEGIAYLVMELLEGQPLRSEMSERGSLSPARCAEILAPVCDVLSVAHAAGIVHRDIKPDNIFLHRTAHGEVVKLLDFGIARLESEDTAPGLPLKTAGVLGTPAYIAPERLLGRLYNGSSDVYALSVVLYEMLCGRVPFRSDEDAPFAVAHMHVNEPPPPLRDLNPSVPAAIEAVVMRGLAKSPNARPTAAELAREFIKALDVEARYPPPPSSTVARPADEEAAPTTETPGTEHTTMQETIESP